MCKDHWAGKYINISWYIEYQNILYHDLQILGIFNLKVVVFCSKSKTVQSKKEHKHI